jgi:hypothetical protein
MRSNALAQNGPWYTVQFADGHSFTFSHDNEGCSEAELSSIATFIAEQSRQTWKLRDDAGPL